MRWSVFGGENSQAYIACNSSILAVQFQRAKVELRSPKYSVAKLLFLCFRLHEERLCADDIAEHEPAEFSNDGLSNQAIESFSIQEIKYPPTLSSRCSLRTSQIQFRAEKMSQSSQSSKLFKFSFLQTRLFDIPPDRLPLYLELQHTFAHYESFETIPLS